MTSNSKSSTARPEDCSERESEANAPVLMCISKEPKFDSANDSESTFLYPSSAPPSSTFDEDALDRALGLLPAASTCKGSSSEPDRNDDDMTALHNPARPQGRRATCEVCQATFGRIYDLDRHVQTHHSNEGSLYECAFCLKSFTRKDGLLRHCDQMHKTYVERSGDHGKRAKLNPSSSK